jgi:hypothetical protein
MPTVLRPDMKAIVWLGIGFLVLPRAMAYVKR